MKNCNTTSVYNMTDIINIIKNEANLTDEQTKTLISDIDTGRAFEWLTFIKFMCSKSTYDIFRKNIHVPSQDERSDNDAGFALKSSDGSYYTGLGWNNQIRNAKIYRNYNQIVMVLNNNNFEHPDIHIIRIEIHEKDQFITPMKGTKSYAENHS